MSVLFLGRKHNIEDILYTIRAVSVSYCLTAIACTGSGVFTLWYAAPDINFPYSSASGVWTGIFVSNDLYNYDIYTFKISLI